MMFLIDTDILNRWNYTNLASFKIRIQNVISVMKKKASKKKTPAANTNESKTNNTITEFHYIKEADFRSIHVDGAYGGLTNTGFLNMSVYTERNVIPRKTTHEIFPNGKLGDEIEELRDSKEGVIRQMVVDLIMNESTARNVRNWLDEKLDEFQQRREFLSNLNLDTESDRSTH